MRSAIVIIIFGVAIIKSFVSLNGETIKYSFSINCSRNKLLVVIFVI